MFFKSANAISLGILIFNQGVSADPTLSALYNSSFGGAGQPPNITDANKDDPASALAMMEFTRLVAYSGCNSIPFMEGLNGTLVSGVFKTSGYENDTLAVGNQTMVGKILAYAAASAQQETFQGDLESVFDAIFGFDVTEGQTSCSLPTWILQQINSLFLAAVNADLAPTSDEEISSWLDFIRSSSRLATQTVSLSPSASLAFEAVDRGLEQSMIATVIALLTGTNHNSSDILTTNILRIVENPAWSLSYTSLNSFTVACYNTANYPFAGFVWAVNNIPVLKDRAVSILAVVMGTWVYSLSAAIEVIEDLSRALPDIPVAEIPAIQYVFYQMSSSVGGYPSLDLVRQRNAKAGLFWMLSQNTAPSN